MPSFFHNKMIIIGFSLLWLSAASTHADERQMPPMFSSLSMNAPSQSNTGHSGLPAELASKQFFTEGRHTSLEQAISSANQVAGNAVQRFLNKEHKGKKYSVPGDFSKIQEAIDAASAGDMIMVAPGIYFEQLTVKSGIRLTSNFSIGDNLAEVEGALKKLPQRAIKTIIDGSKAVPSARGMLDFEANADSSTIIDGFTIQNLPRQNHHIPGHAHAINLRGASPQIINCLVQDNGSTGIGSHVIYNDQDKEIPERDFRQANIKFQASALLYNNIVRRNFGRGIGCNHFATPTIIGNEIMENDDSELGQPGPGIGIKHGASPTITANIVHHNPGGGILAMYGADQGIYPIDLPPSPKILNNIVYQNGMQRPAISCQNSGRPADPVEISNNFITGFGGIGVGLGNKSHGIIENNIISQGRFTGIAVNNSTAINIQDNTISHASRALLIINFSKVEKFSGNRVYETREQPFLVQDSLVEGAKL